jgi:hypothetical protein
MLPNCKFGRTGVKNLKVGKLKKWLRAGGAGRHLRLHHAQPGDDINFIQDAHG